MSDFAFYFDLGWKHIISWDAMDHILFIVALAAIYLLKQWKQVLILVTAFTIGHSLTLALSVYDLVKVNSMWVEFLVPLTIMVTALINVLHKEIKPGSLGVNYFLAAFFGLIHGLGFANTIRFMLSKDQNIGIPLLGFNTGLEAGQLLVVALVLLLAYLTVSKAGIRQRVWIWSVSTLAILFSAYQTFSRWPL